MTAAFVAFLESVMCPLEGRSLACLGPPSVRRVPLPVPESATAHSWPSPLSPAWTSSRRTHPRPMHPAELLDGPDPSRRPVLPRPRPTANGDSAVLLRSETLVEVFLPRSSSCLSGEFPAPRPGPFSPTPVLGSVI